MIQFPCTVIAVPSLKRNVLCANTTYRRLQQYAMYSCSHAMLITKVSGIAGKGQAQQQGGCLIFKGRECVYEYKDPATGRHVNIDEVLDTCLQLV